MSLPMEDLLALYAMDLLDGSERDEVERHLAAKPDAFEVLASFEDTFHALSLEAPEVGAPSAGLLAGILPATEGVGRFDAYVSTIAAMIDYTAEKARALVDSLDEALSWVAGPSPESMLVHFDPGPRVAPALVGFVKVKAGARFPVHTHVGSEVVFVLQGAFEDEDGTVVRRGERREMADGTTHDFTALEGPDLIYLVVLEKGVEFDFPFEI